MGSLPEAFYTPTDDGYEATALTQGPWAAGFQHGGPPAALLAGAMASYGDNADTRLLVRTTVELLRPVPIGVVRVDIEPVRGGRRVDWVRATMWCWQLQPVCPSASRTRTLVRWGVRLRVFVASVSTKIM